MPTKVSHEATAQEFHDYDRLTAASEESFFGGMTVSKVVKEHVALEMNKDGVKHSIGAMIDEYIFDCVKRDEHIAEIKLEFPIEIDKLREFYLPKTVRNA